jgi:WD40 repeat protein
MKLDLEKMRKEKEKKEKEIKKLQEEINNLDIKNKKDKISNDQKITVLPYKKIRPGEKVPWPSDIRNNIYLLQNPPTFNSQPSQSGKVIKAYEKCAVSCMTVHIKKNVVATGGDDAIFKIYDMSKGEELASGSYHNQYISSIDIHPKGSFLATASGDYTINLWDLLTLKVKAQFCHDSVVWSTKFHDTGDFLLSSNDNGLINLYDLNICQVRETYRGHTDSVNKINFQPFTNYFASASSDKSISIWDMRMGLTVQTFYGHLNSINDVIFNPRGDMLYSCDADGIIKAWDIRKVSEAGTWVHYPHIPANCIEVEKTNNYLYCGYDNGFIGTVNLSKNEIGAKFKAHEGPVNGIGINLTNSNMFTAGGDGSLLVWQ